MTRRRSTAALRKMSAVCNGCAKDHPARRRVLNMIFEESVMFFALPPEAVEQLLANEKAHPQDPPFPEWRTHVLPALRALCKFNRKFNAIVEKRD